MAKVVETRGSKEFLKLVKDTFGEGNTRLVDSDTAFSIFLDTGNTKNHTVMVGRFCKASHLGVVMDRRAGNEESGDTLAERLSEAPRRRTKDGKSSGTSYQRGKDCSPDIL